jgi:hypothetical protein
VPLLERQAALGTEAQRIRRDEIIEEMEAGLSGYMRPLGIEAAAGFEETAALFQMVLRLSEEVGLRYKARFDCPRPPAIEPRIRSFIDVPPHGSYPSNHSFQSYSIAHVFARIVPEHPGIAELFRAARRIAENREWAGLHFASDTAAGRLLARMMTPVYEVVLEDQMRRAQAEWF